MSVRQWYLPRGRMNRQTYWLVYTLPLLAAVRAGGLVDDALGWSGASPAPGPLELLVALALLVPGGASLVARLHDREQSAWWLLWYLLPVVGWVLLEVQAGFLRGNTGPNRYGPEPPGRPLAPVGGSGPDRGYWAQPPFWQGPGEPPR